METFTVYYGLFFSLNSWAAFLRLVNCFLTWQIYGLITQKKAPCDASSVPGSWEG